MQLEIGPHLDDAEIEQYSMKSLPDARLAPCEEHLLACDSCQDRLLAQDAWVNGVQSASPKLRKARRPRWRERCPRPVWAAVAVLSVAAATMGWIWMAASPEPIQLSAVVLRSTRGFDGLAVASAAAGRPVSLTVDLTELPVLPSYRFEIVDSKGKPVWQSTQVAREGKIVQPLTKGLPAGQYYVRLYGPGGELLREFSLRVD